MSDQGSQFANSVENGLTQGGLAVARQLHDGVDPSEPNATDAKPASIADDADEVIPDESTNDPISPIIDAATPAGQPDDLRRLAVKEYGTTRPNQEP